MVNIIKKILVFIMIIMMFIFLLTDSKECIHLASKGLLIWFENMIPTLFPFMVVAGFLVKTGLSKILGNIAGVFLRIMFPLSSSMLYAVVMGFTCGFPMGAKVICDLLREKEITEKEGQYLLCFINNIGPLYLIGYTAQLFQWHQPVKYLLIFYAVPLLYGLFLLYFTPYKKMLIDFSIRQQEGKNSNKNRCSYKTFFFASDCTIKFYIKSIFESIHNSLEQITLLGGCMIIFNCLQIFPLKINEALKALLQNFDSDSLFHAILCCLTEIGGGLAELSKIGSQAEFLPIILSLLSFGGLCCIFQTYTIIENTGLSMKKYIVHKIIQSLLTFFVVWTVHMNFFT